MTMTKLRTRVTVDAALLAVGLALAGGWLGGRTALFGVVAGTALALADFWWLSARVDAVGSHAPPALVWLGAAGLRLAGAAVVVAGLFLTGQCHPLALVVGLAVLPCALVARGLRLAREGA
jgi:ATP synthase I chain